MKHYRAPDLQLELPKTYWYVWLHVHLALLFFRYVQVSLQREVCGGKSELVTQAYLPLRVSPFNPSTLPTPLLHPFPKESFSKGPKLLVTFGREEGCSGKGGETAVTGNSALGQESTLWVESSL